MDNATTQKWEKTGLLAELDGFNKNECAYALEECGDLLLKEKNSYMKEIDAFVGDDGYYAGTVLPVIRLLYGEIPEKMVNVSVPWLMEHFGEYVKANYKTFKDLETRRHVDGQAELCKMYSAHVINKL